MAVPISVPSLCGDSARMRTWRKWPASTQIKPWESQTLCRHYQTAGQQHSGGHRIYTPSSPSSSVKMFWYILPPTPKPTSSNQFAIQQDAYSVIEEVSSPLLVSLQQPRAQSNHHLSLKLDAQWWCLRSSFHAKEWPPVWKPAWGVRTAHLQSSTRRREVRESLVRAPEYHGPHHRWCNKCTGWSLSPKLSLEVRWQHTEVWNNHGKEPPTFSGRRTPNKLSP